MLDLTLPPKKVKGKLRKLFGSCPHNSLGSIVLNPSSTTVYWSNTPECCFYATIRKSLITEIKNYARTHLNDLWQNAHWHMLKTYLKAKEELISVCISGPLMACSLSLQALDLWLPRTYFIWLFPTTKSMQASAPHYYIVRLKRAWIQP